LYAGYPENREENDIGEAATALSAGKNYRMTVVGLAEVQEVLDEQEQELYNDMTGNRCQPKSYAIPKRIRQSATLARLCWG